MREGAKARGEPILPRAEIMGLRWELRSPRKSLMAAGFMIESHSQRAASSVVEHVTFNHGAVGSIPTRPTTRQGLTRQRPDDSPV